MFAVPNFFSKETIAGWPGYLPKQQIPLGLDLQGGAHLLLQMDTEKLQPRLARQRCARTRRKSLREAKIAFSGLVNVAGNTVQVRIARPEDSDKALKPSCASSAQQIGNEMLGTGGASISTCSAPSRRCITLTPTEQGLQQRVSPNAAGASIETINRRINAMGTAEIDGGARKAATASSCSIRACRTPRS